jgi:uroporphyrinogen III methyltransferase/synthase
VIVVGDVVSLRETVAWYDSMPLFGKRLILPRPEAQARATARAIRERGAEPLVTPVIEITAPPDTKPLERAVLELGSYAWVLFTSANGVERFFAEVARQGRDARAFASAKVAAIGPKTAAAIEGHGIIPDLVAKEFIGEGLAKELLERTDARGKVLLARALVARDALPDALRDAGFAVDVVPVYETRGASEPTKERLRTLIASGKADAILFTSSSTVTETLSALGSDAAALLATITVASIGPITTGTLREAAVRVDVSAESYTVEGLLDALQRHYLEQRAENVAQTR